MGARRTVCFCGDSYGKYGELPPDKCDAPCLGNRQDKCGRSLFNAVYDLSM